MATTRTWTLHVSLRDGRWHGKVDKPEITLRCRSYQALTRKIRAALASLHDRSLDYVDLDVQFEQDDIAELAKDAVMLRATYSAEMQRLRQERDQALAQAARKGASQFNLSNRDIGALFGGLDHCMVGALMREA